MIDQADFDALMDRVGTLEIEIDRLTETVRSLQDENRNHEKRIEDLERENQ